ncbi:MAG: alpha/beta fold hydrolase [Acidimicrobiales bacterium]
MPDQRPPLHVVCWTHPSRRSTLRLLVHGAMDRASSFGRVAAALDGGTVVAYDRRGYAGSAGRRPSDDFADQVSDLLEVLDGRPAVALGHSVGGDVVLAAAAAHPEIVRAAVVWEPPMPWLPYWPADSAGGVAASGELPPEEAAEMFMVRVVGRRVWGRLPEPTRRRRRSEGGALMAEMRAIRQAAFDPAGVAVPVIVGVGSRSRPHHARATAELAAALPLGSHRTVDGAGHGAHLTHPAVLAGLVEEAEVEEEYGR